MRKEIKLKGCIIDGANFVDGLAVVVGERGSEPWMNLYHRNGNVLAALNKDDMDRLVKAWVRVRGGYPV